MKNTLTSLLLSSVLATPAVAVETQDSFIMDGKRVQCESTADVGKLAYRINSVQTEKQGEDVILSLQFRSYSCVQQAGEFKLVPATLPVSKTSTVIDKNVEKEILHHYSNYALIVWDETGGSGDAVALFLSTTSPEQVVSVRLSGTTAVEGKTVNAFLRFDDTLFLEGEKLSTDTRIGNSYNIRVSDSK